MNNLKTELLFTVSNHHAPDASQCPTLDGDIPHLYHSYFENKFGEQSIFVYNQDTRQAVLWCGDAGWEPYPVVNGRVEELKLTDEELTWLRACWQAIS
jgi:hypothetical protein